MVDFIRGFGFAINGIFSALNAERNFRLQWLAGTMVFLLLNVLPLHFWQELIFVMLIFLVLSFELHNCAIEKTCDSIGKDPHMDKKRAKDFAAGGVLLLSILAFSCFLMIACHEQEIIFRAMVNNPLAFISWALAFICFLPLAFNPHPRAKALLISIVGIFTYIAFVIFNQQITIYLLVGTAFLIIKTIAYSRRFFGLR